MVSVFWWNYNARHFPNPIDTCHTKYQTTAVGGLGGLCFELWFPPKYGSGRMLALAVRILSQLGDFLSNIECLEPAMTLCKKNDLPLVTPIQRKTRAPESNIHAAEPDDETAGSEDYRLSCLAAVAEAFYFINKVESKSLAIISDASDISGADITIFFAYSPVLAAGWLLPHQVTPPLSPLCIVLTVNCLYHSYNVPTIHVSLCFVDCSSTWLINFSAILWVRPVSDRLDLCQTCQTCVRPKPFGVSDPWRSLCWDYFGVKSSELEVLYEVKVWKTWTEIGYFVKCLTDWLTDWQTD